MSVHPTKLVMFDYARSLLPAQYRNKTNWTKLLRCFAKPFQDLEDAFWQLLVERHVSVANEAVLRQLGEIVDEPQEGRSIEAYRTAIRVKILIIVSSGTVPQILQIVSLLMPNLAHQLQPYFPAGFILDIDGTTTAEIAAEIARAVRRTKAGGVAAHVVTSEVPDDDSFLFADDTEIDSTTQGLADTDEDGAGGALADVQG
jgi:hypothetical protein